MPLIATVAGLSWARAVALLAFAFLVTCSFMKPLAAAAHDEPPLQRSKTLAAAAHDEPVKVDIEEWTSDGKRRTPLPLPSETETGSNVLTADKVEGKAPPIYLFDNELKWWCAFEGCPQMRVFLRRVPCPDCKRWLTYLKPETDDPFQYRTIRHER